MLTLIFEFLVENGLDEGSAAVLARVIGLGAVAALSCIAFVVAKKVLLRVASAIVKKTRNEWDDRLLQHRVLFWIAHLAPALVIYFMVPEVLGGAPASILITLSKIYMLLVGVLAVDSFLNACHDIYLTLKIARQFHIKGFVQVAKIILYLTAVILLFAMLLGKTPLYLLSGLGVFASVLMLVFKDPILGFVAGIQLSSNRMLEKGDWIEMPKHGADGDVIDIALTTVKVQNWDKTITTVPTYSLISDSFKNWRGMSDSGGRRIKRSIHIDVASIKLCTPEALERFSKIQHIAEYVESKRKEIVDWNNERGADMSDAVNARQLTNVGTFRAYILAYLKNHPQINPEMTLLVRQLDPGPDGLPIEVYCFTKDKRWEVYEDIQADIFDHILAVASEFDLTIFQSPSGADFRRLGT